MSHSSIAPDEDLGDDSLREAVGLGDAALSREADLIAPRISIEAFCVTPGFASAMQTAAADRRMAKTKTQVGMGGCGAAVKRYADRGTPNLVIVESEEEGFGVFAELERLAAVCGEDARVLVAGPSNDVSLYRELIRQGVADYLVTPSSPLQIIEAVTNIYATPDAAPVARSVVVYGVRGGVGASVIAHNLAASLAQMLQKDTVLADLDFEFGTAALDFNIEAKHTIVEALYDLDDLDDVKVQRLLHKHSEHLSLLPAPADLKDKLWLNEDAALSLLDALRHACDMLVVDAPHAWSPGVACALRQAETIVLVAAPDLACLRNLKSVADWLQEERPHDAPPKIVLNQVGVPKRPEISSSEFKEIIGAEVDLSIPYDPGAFGEAQNDGKLLSQISSGQRAAAKIDALAQSLVDRGAGASAAGKARSGGSDAKDAKGAWLGALSRALGRK